MFVPSFFQSACSILALGAESCGNFSIFCNNALYLSGEFGDLLNEKNFTAYKKSIFTELKKNNIVPDIIVTDLHPFYRSTLLGKELTRKFRAKQVLVQHHVAHIFASAGSYLLQKKEYRMPDFWAGTALDGTGYGDDETIWGGEIFTVTKIKNKNTYETIRTGHLENQMMTGGDMVVKEPARMLIGIFDKFLSKNESRKMLNRYYSSCEFDLLYNQMKDGFNCRKTSSTGRILDAASVLLGIAGNTRNEKHEATYLLDKIAAEPYRLSPVISEQNGKYILATTPLFEYLYENRKKDKGRLAATAEYYIARGLYDIIQKIKPPVFFLSGGLSGLKIISGFLKEKGGKLPTAVSYGDGGISFGQLWRVLNGI